MDSSPSMNKYHFSPSNLSGDSGLISDSQFYDEDGNGNDIPNDNRNYSRSNSHYLDRNVSQDDLDPQSQSLDSPYYNYQYNHNNPVPPPRRARRKGSDPSNSPNMDYERKPMRYTGQANYNIPSRYDKKFSHNADKYKRSTESLKSVEESSEADSEVNMKNYKPADMGTLVKSASGAHLYFEEITSPTLYEFGNINRLNNSRAHLYKQSSDGAMPMSPQSKYSLCSSHDSVLSDSSGSFLNRPNSPDPLSSSGNTPDTEDGGMTQWLSQQSKHTAYASAKQSRISQDDSEVGVKVDKKPVNKLSHLGVSPKTSPKLRRRSPIPLEARRSYPLQPQVNQRGSGSNTSKEAEDIIKSPKLTVTYCSQDSLDKRAFDSPQQKPLSPHLDIYNNNSQTAMKQLNIYSHSLQGTSPPPRLVLQGLSSQTQKRENTPVKGNHSILPQQRRNSFDSAEFIEHKQKYPMEENSVSSEDEGSETESEPESYSQMKQSLKLNIPSNKVTEHHKSASESSSVSDDSLTIFRPENPPAYDEAVHRNRLIKQGLSPDSGSDNDAETIRQREASLRAKQLFEQSQRMYHQSQNQQKFAQTLGAHKEVVSEEETESITSSSEDEASPQATMIARKLYEESLKRYQEEQNSRSPLKKSSSEDRDNISLSKPKGGQQNYSSSLSPHSSNIHRSCSDVGDLKGHLNRSPSGSSRTSSNDSTPTRRPNQPPPYNNPPPYHTDRVESSPSDAKRHLFPRAGENVFTAKTVSNTSIGACTQSLNTDMQSCSVSSRKDNILVSNRGRTSAVSQSVEMPARDNTLLASSTDYTVQSAQVDLSKYKSAANIRNRDSSLDSKYTANMTQTRQPVSDNVFRNRASSAEPKPPQTQLEPRTTQRPISYRNPNLSQTAELSKSQPHFTNPNSAVSKASGQKELPWSVKHLSNMFDTSKNGSVSARSSPVVMQTSPRAPPVYTPPPTFQRSVDNMRSSTSSNSSMSSAGRSGAGRTPGKTNYGKFGPQARDSFSSTDESDCSCRYSLNCRRDNSSLEELTDVSLTDITYV